MEEKVTHPQNKKLTLEKAKQELFSELNELKGVGAVERPTIRGVEVRLSELKKAYVDSFEMVSRLKSGT